MNTIPTLARYFRAGLAALILLAAGLLPLPRPAVAQSYAVQMTVTPAYSGYFKYGDWLPLWVELSNQGGDLEGAVRVQVPGSQGSLVFEAPVSLPAGARKLLPVYVLPNNFSRELDVRLVSGDTAVAVQKAAVHPEPNISYFAGLVAPERGALSFLNGVRFSGQERQKILVDLTLAELPDRAEAMRSFDLLVLNDTDTSKLTPSQVAALNGWVQQGGHLVIGGGAGAQRTFSGLPDALTPVKLLGSQELTSSALQPLATFAGSDPITAAGTLLAARAELPPAQSAGDAAPAVPASRILSGDASLPLVVERTSGAGAVDFVAFDLAGAPFNGWPGSQNFWQALIGPSGEYPVNMPFDVSPRAYRASSLTYALSNIPTLDLPSISSISFLLVIYIIVVGPLNFLFLRWRRRMHWAWITIPVITVLFTAGAFGIGYGLRGTDLILNRIALVELQPGGRAAVTSYMGLFSPRMQSYEINVHGDSLVSPMTNFDGSPFGSSQGIGATGAATGEMVLVQGQPARVRGLSVNQWSMQTFMAESDWTDFGQITTDLQIQNEAIMGTVRNDTQYTIKDVILTAQSRFVELGEMAPGAQKTVNLALSNLQTDRFGPPLSYRLYQQRYPNGPMPREIEQRSNIVNAVFENTAMSKISSKWVAPGQSLTTSGSVIVFGWIDQAPPAVDVTGSRLAQRTTALVYTTASFRMAQNGLVTVPTGMIPGSIVKNPVNGGVCGSPTSVVMSGSGGVAEFSFQIPGDPQSYKVNTLKVGIMRDNPGTVNTPDVALYDWQAKTWVTIQDYVLGTNIIQNAAPYVDPNGAVRVQVTAQTDTMGCIYIDLGMEAAGANGASSTGGAKQGGG